MGHYDSSRPGYCGKCGAGPGNIRADGTCNICITDAAHTRTLGTTATQRERRAKPARRDESAADGTVPDMWVQLTDRKAADLVNRVRDLAQRFHDHDSLRDRLAATITPEVIPVNPRTLPMLRELRLWHWRQCKRFRRLEREFNADTTGNYLGMAEAAENAFAFHIKQVQLLNIFFDPLDTAEKDDADGRQQTAP